MSNMGDDMPDKRIEMAIQKRDELQKKLDKVKGSPREEEFQLQINKLNELIDHLEKQ